MLVVPKTGASHQHLKRLKNSTCTPSRSPKNGASRAPEWRLECSWHGAWSAPRMALQKTPWIGTWKAPRMALLRALNDTSWMSETAPNDTFSDHQTGAKTAPLTGIARSACKRHRWSAWKVAPGWRLEYAWHGTWSALGTTLGLHRSSRRCKEDTVPSFYALRLVLI